MSSRIFRINLFVSTKALVGILIGSPLNLDQFEGTWMCYPVEECSHCPFHEIYPQNFSVLSCVASGVS